MPEREMYEPIDWDQRRVIADDVRRRMTLELASMGDLKKISVETLNQIAGEASSAVYQSCSLVKAYREKK